MTLHEASLVDACTEAHGHGKTAIRRATMLLSKLSTAAPNIPERSHQPLTLVFPMIRSR